MIEKPISPITKGTFLIASPEIEQGLYFRSVVLICEHNPGGSFGLIINKPLDVQLPYQILEMDEMMNPRIRALSGGAIQPSQMMLLHSNPTIPEQTLNICKGVFLGGNLEFLQKEITNPEGSHIKLCFGYCAWSSGQLEKEMLAGAWFASPASDSYLFEVPPEQVWKSILREMGGKYANFSMIPEDLSLN